MGRPVYEGLKVLDVTNNYAGPMAGSMLADYGAEVWHIEKPVLGDDNRFPSNDRWHQHQLLHVQPRKKVCGAGSERSSRCGGIQKAGGKSRRPAESYRPGVMKKLGLSYEDLKEINPRLIYCSISAYGQTGPYASRPGYDVIAQAVSGIMEMTGEPDGQPTKIGPAIGDWMGALNAFGCIGTALYYRSICGRGQRIDISLARSPDVDGGQA